MNPEQRDELLRRALARGGDTHTPADIMADVEANRLQLWEGVESLIVTQIVENPRVKECNFFLAAGDLDEIEDLYPIVEDWARSVGCTRLVFAGRHGWAKTFLTREAGWTAPMTVFVKEIAHG